MLYTLSTPGTTNIYTFDSDSKKICIDTGASTGRVGGLEVSILRVVGSYPTQWTSMYVLVNPNPYETG
jgi:hypothetical protein